MIDTEYAWVIEAGSGPHYWTGKTAGVRHLEAYSSDVQDAVRFSRFEDAEVIRCHLIPSGVHWRSVHHGFVVEEKEQSK